MIKCLNSKFLIYGAYLLTVSYIAPQVSYKDSHFSVHQPAFTCSTLTIETLEQGVKYVQS